jgi:spermidine synthase
MKPRIKLGEVKTSDGERMSLYEHDGTFSISLNGQELMHSKANVSECLLGQLGVARLKGGIAARVLVGGLGLGFTLRSVLEAVGSETMVELVELIPEVIEWNRAHLQGLNGSLLEDPRVIIRAEDVTKVIREAEAGSYDVILLDVDNGPIAMVAKTNRSLYSNYGIGTLRAVLKPDARAVFWSAGPDRKFEVRLRKGGFKVKVVPAKMNDGSRRPSYVLYVADRD